MAHAPFGEQVAHAPFGEQVAHAPSGEKVAHAPFGEQVLYTSFLPNPYTPQVLAFFCLENTLWGDLIFWQIWHKIETAYTQWTRTTFGLKKIYRNREICFWKIYTFTISEP